MERTPEPLGKALEEVPPPQGELAKVAGGTGPRSELDMAFNAAPVVQSRQHIIHPGFISLG